MSTRRNLLTGAVGAVAVGAVLSMSDTAAAPHPDARLLAACAEYLRIQREWEAYCASVPGDIQPDDPHADRIFAGKDALVEQIVSLSATTAEGHLARARCIAWDILPGSEWCQDDPEAAEADRFRAAERRDLVAMGRGDEGRVPEGVFTTEMPSPDADLLAACTAFDRLERSSHATFQSQKPGSPEEEAADAERDRLAEAQAPLIDRICDLRAVTREGQAARARSLTLWDAELMKPNRAYPGDRLTAAIVRDLIEVGASE